MQIQPQKIKNKFKKSICTGLVLLLFVTGCANLHKITPAETAPQEFTFPKDFLWGSGTSSHQVEGNNMNNDWWQWEQRLPLNMRSGQAADQWNRFEDDFKLAQALGHTAYRFSLEWSRIEPQEDQFDTAALEHYYQIILSLRSKGIEPIVVLNHFALPLWLSRQGGWFSEKTPELFARYVQKTTEALGVNVHYWVTLNEPVVYAFRGYIVGDWPPGEKSLEKAIKVCKNLLLGHVLAYKKIKETYLQKGWKAPMVGIAKHVIIFRASSDYSLLDRMTARFTSWLFNHVFVQALVRGQAYCIGLFNVHLPQAKTLDFIGLNYYTRAFVVNHGFEVPGIYIKQYTKSAGQYHYTGKNNFFSAASQDHNTGEDKFLSWEIYAKGMYAFLKDFSRYKLPILISENGISTNDDTEREVFIVEHLKAVARAMKEGAPVIGYLYWSLLDIYEWNKGLTTQFGLIEVDFTTQERKIRESAIKFEEIIRSGKLNF
jgi:beta-glucosidase